MRLSHLIGRTLRQPPAGARLVSHQFLARAGFIRYLEGGRAAYLPLGVWTLRRLQGLLRQVLTEAGGQELVAPPNLALPAIACREIDSYRQLPAIVFAFGQAGDDEPPTHALTSLGVRAGAAGVAHVHVLTAAPHPPESGAALADAMSEPNQASPALPQEVPLFSTDGGDPIAASLDRLLAAASLVTVWADGAPGEQRLYLVHPAGDEVLARCPACGYAAERSHTARPTQPWPLPPGESLPLPEEIETPGCNTIAALAEFLHVPASQTLKMVFYSVAGHVTCVAIRGDRAVDDARLARLLGTDRYYASVEDELAAVGAVGGYASPIGLRRDRVRVVADPGVQAGHNWITGANRPGWHLRNVNLPRDFEPDEWVDLALIMAGDPCPRCGGPLSVEDAFGLAMGRAPEPAGADYLDEAGRPRPIWTTAWEVDAGRLLAAIAEQHHDDYGLVWPAACAPLDVHLVALDPRFESDGQTVGAVAEALYQRLLAEGLAVLYDDREASAGVKFADADLIGLPLRLTIGKRSLADGTVEAKWRAGPDRLKLDEAGLAAELARLQASRLP